MGDLKRLISHVSLPSHVQQTITAIYKGHGFESLPGFIDVLRKEKADGKFNHVDNSVIGWSWQQKCQNNEQNCVALIKQSLPTN